MSFRLKRREKPRAGISRIVREQGETLLRSIQTQTGPHPESLHEARKCVKRMRALLRLVREILPPERFEEENHLYRTVGREFSAGRDAEVLVGALRKLRKHCGKSEHGLFHRSENLLKTRRKAILSEFPSHRARVEQQIRAALNRTDDWPLWELKSRDLVSGVRRAYKKGRSSLRRARKRPTAENLHVWRKRVKDLWYDLCVLNCRTSKNTHALIHAAKKLSEYIGDDHDLFLLDEALKESALKKRPRHKLALLIKRRRHQLQCAAFDLGAKLYEEKPAAFATGFQRSRRR